MTEVGDVQLYQFCRFFFYIYQKAFDIPPLIIIKWAEAGDISELKLQICVIIYFF